MSEETTKNYGHDTLRDLFQKLEADVVSDVVEDSGDGFVDDSLFRDLSGLSEFEEPTAETEPGGSPTQPERSALPSPLIALPSSPMFTLDRLVPLLEREIEQAPPPLAGALACDLADIHQGCLEQAGEAERWYRVALEQEPRLATAARSLAWMCADRGDPREALDSLAQEIPAVDGDARAAALVDRALLRFHDLAEPEAARDDLLEALSLAPGDPIATDLMEEICRTTGDLSAAEQLTRQRLDASADPAFRSMTLCKLARLARNSERERALYEEALDALPENTYALRGLLHIARDGTDRREEAGLLRRLGERETGPTAAASLTEAAQIWLEHLADPNEALTCLELALERSDDDPLVLLELARLQERLRRWSDLAVTLERSLRSAGSGMEAASLAYRLATIRLDRLEDRRGALSALRQAVDLCPEHAGARRLLGRMYQQDGDHEQLIGLLTVELQLFSEPDRRGVTWYRIGQLAEQQAHDPARAAQAYASALDELPGYRPALSGLDRTLSALGRLEDLVAAHETAIASTDDATEKARILRRIGSIWEHDLEDGVAALHAYERLLAIAPDDSEAAQALQRLYNRNRRWPELIDALKHEARHCGSPRWRAAVYDEALHLQLFRTRDLDGALATGLDLLEASPDHWPALEWTAHLLARREDWTALRSLLERQLASGDTRHRPWLLFRLAAVQERLDAPDRAALLYLDALSSVAGARVGADRLLHLLRDSVPGTTLAGIRRLPPPEGPCRALHHRRVAELLTRWGQPVPLVEEQLRRALVADPGDRASLEHLALVHGVSGETGALADDYSQLLDCTDGEPGEGAAHHKLAWVWSQGGELDRARDVLATVRQRFPESGVVLRQLRWLAASTGAWAELVEVAEQLIDLSPRARHPDRSPGSDDRYPVGAGLEAAGLRERQGELEHAAKLARQVLTRDPDNPEALALLERHARVTNDAASLSAVLTRYCSAAQTASERAAWLTSLAALAENDARPGEALQILQTAAGLEPGYLPAAVSLRRLARRLGDGPALARALEREAELSALPARRNQSLYEAARIWQLEGDEVRAMESYGRLLGLGLHQPALEALLRLHHRRGEHRQALDRLDRAIDQSSDTCQRLGLMTDRIRLLLTELDDGAAARETLHSALAQEISREQLTALRLLFREAGDQEAVAAVERRLSPLCDHQPQAADPEGDTRVLDLDSESSDSLLRLSEVLVEQKSWIAASRALERLVERSPQEAARHYLRLSHVRSEGLGDHSGAVEACRSALAIAPEDEAAAERLSALLTRIEAPEITPPERDPLDLELYPRLARVYESQGRDDGSYLARSVLLVLGGGDDEDRRFVDSFRRRAPTVRRPLAPLDFRDVAHPEQRPLHRLLAAVEPGLRETLSPLERGRPKARRFTSRSCPRITERKERLDELLQPGRYNALTVTGGVDQLAVEDTTPPTLYVGRALEKASEVRLDFLLGRQLAKLRYRHPLAQRLGSEGLDQLLSGSTTWTDEALAPVVARIREEIGPFDTGHAVDLAGSTEDRLGMLVSGDVRAAILEVASQESGVPADDLTPDLLQKRCGPRLRDLLLFIISDTHLMLRERLSRD